MDILGPTATGKGAKVLSVKRAVRPATDLPGAVGAAATPRPLTPQRIVPAFARSALGNRTWRSLAAQQSNRAVYLCYWDLCECGYELSKGFLQHTRNWGMECLSSGTSWVAERVWHRVDLTDPDKNDQAVFSDKVARADVVHLCEYHNFPYLSMACVDKRMVIHHHGVQYRDNPLQYEKQEVEAGYLRLVSTPDLLIHGTSPYRETLKWLPSPIDLRELDRNFPRWGGTPEEEDRPVRVLHGYTVKGNKGTATFEAIVEREQECGLNIEYGPVNHVQKRIAMWLLSQADLYFATFLCGPGMATVEAMAFGIPVLVGCSADELAAQKECYGDPLPFVYVTPDTCGKVLRQLVNEPAMREEYGRRGREAVERLHAVPAVVKRLKGYYEETEPCRFLVQA